MKRAATTVGATVVVSAGITFALGGLYLARVEQSAFEPAFEPATTQAAPAPSCQEDNSCWNCARMGDWVCGPGNDNGLAAGCYGQRNGDTTLIEPWPCHTLVDANGDRQVYKGLIDLTLPPPTGLFGPAFDAPPNGWVAP